MIFATIGGLIGLALVLGGIAVIVAFALGRDVEADAGVKLDWAIWAGLGMLVVGLLSSGGAAALILLIGRGADRDASAG